MAQRRAKETRARILAAAEACFARGGYDATGVAEICQRAGVTKGAFYHHFPTKQSIFMALLRDWLDRLDTGLETLSASAPTVPEGLLNMASMIRLVLQVGGGRLPMFLEFWKQASHDPEVWQTTVEPYRRYRDLFAGIVRTGITEGTLRPVDADTAAVVIVALAIGLLLQGLLDPQGSDWGLITEDGMRMLLDGLGQHKTVGAGSLGPWPTNPSDKFWK